LPERRDGVYLFWESSLGLYGLVEICEGVSQKPYFGHTSFVARTVRDRFGGKYDCSVHPKEFGMDEENVTLLDEKKVQALERSLRQIKPRKKVLKTSFQE